MSAEKKNLKFGLRTQFAAFLVAAAASLLFTACGKSGGGGTNAAPIPVMGPGGVAYGGVPNCQGCNGMLFLDAAMGETIYAGGSGTELALEFYGVGAQLGGYGAGGFFQGGGQYEGPYAANGRLVVKVPMQACGIPAGVYQVQTVQPGMWGYRQSFQGGELRGQGPTQLRIAINGYVQASIPPGQSIVDGRTFPYRIQGRMQMFGPQAMMPCDDLIF